MLNGAKYKTGDNMKPMYRQLFICKNKDKPICTRECSGTFYTDRPKGFDCFLWNEDIISWEKQIGSKVTVTKVDMREKKGD